jgi:trk system potassium uptake protein TrkA
MKNSRFAVIGLGKFGTAIARKLSMKGAEVIGIDHNESHIENIKEEVAYAVCLDATDKKALISQNIQDVDAVVVAIGENFEALLLSTVYLQELNVKRIIARANGEHQRKILEKMDVQEILSPEDEVGKVVAERLLNPSVVSVLQLPDDYEIAEIKAPKGTLNRTLEDINLRDKYKLNLVTIKREYEVKKDGEITFDQHIVGVPQAETVIYESDTIVVFGMTKDIEKFIEINQ